MPKFRKSIFLITALFMSACTTMPNGPSTMALPGTGKDFEQFRVEDDYCKQYAYEQIGGTTATQRGNDSFARSAVAGTAIGAVAGAAIGGGRGAGIGAATGLLVGGAAGANAAEVTSYTAQQRYDNAYVQCMYAKGNRVPVSGRMMREQRRSYYPPPPPPGYEYER
jgi:hypothetical protein